MNTTFGEVSWSDDVNFGNGKDKKSTDKDLWLRLKEGSNVVRLVTQPHQYIVHRGIKKKGEKGYGRKVSCSSIHGECALCAKGLKASPRWLVGVIDRESGQYRVLDISYQIFNDVRKLARKVDVWGDPQKYDIDIIVDKKGGPSGYYSVQPIPHKPLSPTDQNIRDNADLEFLKQKTQPLTPDVVQKILNKIAPDGDIAMPEPKDEGETAKTKAVKVKGATVHMTDEEDVNDIFPAYEGNNA